jgi:hypothetical protein
MESRGRSGSLGIAFLVVVLGGPAILWIASGPDGGDAVVLSIGVIVWVVALLAIIYRMKRAQQG